MITLCECLLQSSRVHIHLLLLWCETLATPRWDMPLLLLSNWILLLISIIRLLNYYSLIIGSLPSNCISLIPDGVIYLQRALQVAITRDLFNVWWPWIRSWHLLPQPPFPLPLYHLCSQLLLLITARIYLISSNQIGRRLKFFIIFFKAEGKGVVSLQFL